MLSLHGNQKLACSIRRRSGSVIEYLEPQPVFELKLSKSYEITSKVNNHFVFAPETYWMSPRRKIASVSGRQLS